MKKYLLILPLLLFPFVSFASIAFDNHAQAGDGSFANLTATLTVGSGSGRAVFACIEGTTQAADRITGVTFTKSGVPAAMTLISHSKGASGRWTSLWFGLNPDSGSNAIKAVSSPTDIIGISTVSYSGVNQSMQYIPVATDASTSGSFTSSTMSQNVTTISDNSWAVLCYQGPGIFTATGGSVARDVDSNGYGFADNNAAITPPGIATIAASNSNSWTVQMASFSPTAAAPSTAPYNDDSQMLPYL